MISPIPPVLAPYIQQCIEEHSLALLTSILDTPTNWLLTRLLVSALQRNNHGNSVPMQPGGNATRNVKVIFVSVFRPFETWSDLARKCGVNLQDALTSSKLCYIDGLAVEGNATPGSLWLGHLTLQDLNACLTAAIKDLSSQDFSGKIVTFIDGLDFLLACQPRTTSSEMQQMLLELESRVHSVIVTCAADSALLHNTEASATPLELEHATLVRSLAHQAKWLFQLRPLDTGQSREVSGSVRLSKGGAWESSEKADDLGEGEWLFHFRNDGGVKVWGRGEA